MRTLFALCLTALVVAPVLGAQERGTDRQSLPRSVAREVARRYNEPAERRTSGSLRVPVDEEVDGNVAVLNGPVTISGRVRGNVVVINGDVELRRRARIDGDLIVVGGIIEGLDDAYVGGEVQHYRQALRYREEDDRIVAEGAADRRGHDDDEDDGPSRHRGRMDRWKDRVSYGTSRLSVTTGGTYNRVEGLPIYAGPVIDQHMDWGRFRLEAYGIARTADNFRWNSDNLGHDARMELQLGRGAGIAFGGRLFDIVDGVEDWHLRDSEVGLASFFLHFDYRDYYARHGGNVYTRLQASDRVGLTLSAGEENWASRATNDPWTLFKRSDAWRPNPTMDDGRMRLYDATLKVDSRNDQDDPWSGWFITANVERGQGDSLRLASAETRGNSAYDPKLPGRAAVQYTRGFLDLRRYNRLSPEGQLNLRVVLGGWLDGDHLPLERRLSVGGPGTLPGYDFRDRLAGEDMLQCTGASSPRSSPVQCERVAMAQIEYRGDLHVNFGRIWDSRSYGREGGSRDGWRSEREARGNRRDSRGHWDYDNRGSWVIFADAGRGWLVGDKAGAASLDPSMAKLVYDKGAFPALNTFRTDVGLGLETGEIGFYVAKSTTDTSEPVNFFVRVRRRF